MEEWLEFIIFAVVIIANIIGGIVKIKQKKKAAENKLPPVAEDEYEYMQEEYSEEFEDKVFTAVPIYQEASAVTEKKSEPVPSVSETLEVIETDDKNNGFDYGEFIRSNGKEAFVLSEIILPGNSRRGAHR